MKCRKVIKNKDTEAYDVSFFNSIGLGDIKSYYYNTSSTLSKEECTVLPNEGDRTKLYAIMIDGFEKYYYIWEDKYLTVTVEEKNPNDNHTASVICLYNDEYVQCFTYANIQTEEDFNTNKDSLYDLVDGDDLSFHISKTKDVTPFKSKKPYEDSLSSYAIDSSEMVANDLIAKLSVIKGELWYNKPYGLPLFDKNRTTSFIDATILKIVTTQYGVVSIIRFKSEMTKDHNYNAEIAIRTIFGDITITI